MSTEAAGAAEATGSVSGVGPLGRFFAVLAFLSRLAPARVLAEADMRRAMFHLPLCGLVLGLCIAAPAWAGLFDGRPAVQGWLCVALSLWLTRGLHLDGWCDILDAAGNHVEPERFWRIIKDSRCGSFAVAGAVLLLGGQGLLFAEVLRALPAWSLIWVFVAGRSVAVLFGWRHRALIRPGLGGLFLSGADWRAVLWALVLALVPALWLRPIAALWACVAACVFLLPLSRLAKAAGGVNGDFLGAAVLLGETAAAAGLVLSLP